MNTNQFEVLPGTQLANRFFWLVIAPTASCFGSWGMVAISGHHPSTALVTAALLPVAGMACVLGYRWLTRDVVRLAAYLPFALGVAVLVPSTIDLAVAISREPDGAFIPILPMGVGFVLPFVAFVCGLCAFSLVEPRTRA